MHYSLRSVTQLMWDKNVIYPMLAVLCAVAGILCIVLSTLFGVSHFSDWLLDAGQGFFLLGVVVFSVYIFSGIIRDARAI